MGDYGDFISFCFDLVMKNPTQSAFAKGGQKYMQAFDALNAINSMGGNGKFSGTQPLLISRPENSRAVWPYDWAYFPGKWWASVPPY